MVIRLCRKLTTDRAICMARTRMKIRHEARTEPADGHGEDDLTLRRRKICEQDVAKLNATQRGCRCAHGLELRVAIGLIWSVAAISKWVPVDSAEMRSAAYRRM